MLAPVLAPMEVGAAVQLVGRDVEVTVAGQRQGVGPQQARIVDQGFPFPIRPAAVNGVVLVVGGV